MWYEGEKLQVNIWKGYLLNIADHYKDAYKARIVGDDPVKYTIEQMPIYSNPWQNGIPVTPPQEYPPIIQPLSGPITQGNSLK
jgi:hypothetical protein